MGGLLILTSILSINLSVDGEYQVNQFQQKDVIISPTFPDLKLAVAQVFDCSVEND